MKSNSKWREKILQFLHNFGLLAKFFFYEFDIHNKKMKNIKENKLQVKT